MDKVRFGRTELLVSKVALGGIPIMRLNFEEAKAVVHEALSLGVNFIDTARFYTDSEEKIGAAIRGIPREELVLSTKSMGQTAEELTSQLDASLAHLGVDYIDIFHLHSVSNRERYNNVFVENGPLQWLQNQVEAGKVRFAAFSSHTIDLAVELMQTNLFDVVQLPFNCIEHKAEGAVQLARELDMGFICMKPLGGGRIDDPGPAFRFLMQYDNIVPNPGIERPEELREIVAVVEAGESLSEADESYITELREDTGVSWCHRCDYCQPCPKGIPISGALLVESIFKRYNSEGAHAMTDGPIALARKCAKCGTCLRRCPYKLNIPTLLVENIALYDQLTQNE